MSLTAVETAKPVKLFISYSHKDVRLKNQLLTHLNAIVHNDDSICLWDDQQVMAGAQWYDEVLENLNDANVIVCLLSSAFINSDAFYLLESQKVFERCANKQVKVIPVLLQPVAWRSTIFRDFVIVPRKEKPIASYTNRDRAFTEITYEIDEVVKEFMRTSC